MLPRLVFSICTFLLLLSLLRCCDVYGDQFSHTACVPVLIPTLASHALRVTQQVMAVTSEGPVGKFVCKFKTFASLCMLHMRLLREVYYGARMTDQPCQLVFAQRTKL